MNTTKKLTEDGLKFKRFRWRWLPFRYELSTSEFSENGDFWEMDYKTYLTLWASKLNKFQRGDKYIVVWVKKLHDKHCTIVEITGSA